MPEMLACRYCGREFPRPHNRGTIPRYCSPAHRQAAFRERGLSDSDKRARMIEAERLLGLAIGSRGVDADLREAIESFLAPDEAIPGGK